MARKQRVSRVVYGAFVVVVAAFVVSNVSQVALVVFGESSERANVPKVGAACGEAIAEELRLIEMARQTATSEIDVEAAKTRYAAERKSFAHATATASVTSACAGDPHGTDALAAIARLDRASESHALRDVGELRPVRLAAHSFISGHPR